MDGKQTPEERFRDDLLNVVALTQKLAPMCKTVDDLIAVCSLGLDNEGQLRLLMMAAASKTK